MFFISFASYVIGTVIQANVITEHPHNDTFRSNNVNLLSNIQIVTSIRKMLPFIYPLFISHYKFQDFKERNAKALSLAYAPQLPCIIIMKRSWHIHIPYKVPNKCT